MGLYKELLASTFPLKIISSPIGIVISQDHSRRTFRQRLTAIPQARKHATVATNSMITRGRHPPSS